MTGFLAELFSLEGRVAVVTGGSSGIGEAMASALALAGAQVVIVARDPTRLSATCQVAARGGLRGRVGERGPVRPGRGAPGCVRRGGRVRRAGHPGQLRGGEPPPAARVAVRGALGPDAGGQPERAVPARAAVRPGDGRQGWGRIINVTSQQAQRAFGNSGGYGASKGGLAALTRSQSEAWAADGVCVNSVCPGFVATPLTPEVAADPVRSAAMAARTHLGRNGEPSDFAGVAVFLASTASDYVTGQTIYVDGGFSAV